MDVLILGAGLMGSVMARDMVRQEQVEKVTLLDAEEESRFHRRSDEGAYPEKCSVTLFAFGQKCYNVRE